MVIPIVRILLIWVSQHYSQIESMYIPSSTVSKSRFKHWCTELIKRNTHSFHWSLLLPDLMLFNVTIQMLLFSIVSFSMSFVPSKQERHSCKVWSAMCLAVEGKFLMFAVNASKTSG